MRRLDDISIRRLQELPIAEVVERYTHLTPGPNNTICCPFHAEKTPSCHLYSDHLHCFGCGAHTDNIGFVMLHKNLPFLAACQSLAETFHIELSYQDSPQHNTRTTQEDEHLQTLQQTLNTIRTLSIQTLNNAVPNDTSRKLEVGSNVPKGTSRKLEVGSREIESADTSNFKLPTSNLSEAPAPTSYCRDLYSDSVALITIEDSIRRDSIVWRRVRAQLAVQVKNQRLKIQEGSDEYSLPTSNFVLSPLGALLPTSNLQLARSAWGYFVGVSYSPQMGIGIDGGVRYKRLYLGAELRSRAVVEHNQLCYGVRAGLLF